MKRLNDRGLITRAAVVLMVLIAVMLVIIAIPSWQVFRYRSEKTGCVQAMKSAKDGLIIEYLDRFEEGDEEDARQTLIQVMPARPDICPAGGTVYLIKNSIGIFEPVCGMHDDDTKLRVRLNASRAASLTAEALRIARRETKAEPESVTITLNGKPLECVRVDEVLELRRGTRLTNGYKGIVAFYGIAGEGDFKPSGNVKKGGISYFVYADENHCARWIDGDGWTGDAYQQP